jgi:hypothetical protein
MEDINETGVVTFEVKKDFINQEIFKPNFAAAIDQYQLEIADDIRTSKANTSQEYVKWGKDNKLPYRLMDDMFNNPLSLGILYLQSDITFGNGLIAYRKSFDEKTKKIVKEPILDNEISDYLERINANETAEKLLTDYYATGNLFAQVIRGRGLLIKNNPKNYIADIVHTDASEVRLGVKLKNQKNADKVFLNDWKNEIDANKEAIPMLIPEMLQPKSVYHGMRYVTTQKNYGLPQHIGAQKWTKQIALVPDYILALMRNILSVRFIIKIPKDYWEKNGLATVGDAEALKKARTKTIDEIRSFLSGSANAGNALAFFKENDQYKGIEIESVKDETQYDAFLPNYQQGISAITNSFGVDPALAGIKQDGKLSNAAEQHWSYRIYSLIRTPKPRQLVEKLYNYAIKTNFPRTINENICVGFETIELEALADNKAGFTQNIN